MFSTVYNVSNIIASARTLSIFVFDKVPRFTKIDTKFMLSAYRKMKGTRITRLGGVDFLQVATVRIGRVRTGDPSGNSSLTRQSLEAEGFDSVKFLSAGGTEYVVYNPKRITKIERL